MISRLLCDLSAGAAKTDHDNHLSMRHTRMFIWHERPNMPILPCSRWGLPYACIAACVRALLPHIFTL